MHGTSSLSPYPGFGTLKSPVKVYFNRRLHPVRPGNHRPSLRPAIFQPFMPQGGCLPQLTWRMRKGRPPVLPTVTLPASAAIANSLHSPLQFLVLWDGQEMRLGQGSFSRYVPDTTVGEFYILMPHNFTLSRDMVNISSCSFIHCYQYLYQLVLKGT